MIAFFAAPTSLVFLVALSADLVAATGASAFAGAAVFAVAAGALEAAFRATLAK
jgi:hypothetical protein